MGKRPEDIAAELTPPKRVLLFCVASGTDWGRFGIQSATVQLAILRDLVERDPTDETHLVVTHQGARGAGSTARKGEAMTEGARFAIVVDGVVRTHRDTREAALEAANVLKALNPYGKIVIRDLQTGAEIDPQNP